MKKNIFLQQKQILKEKKTYIKNFLKVIDKTIAVISKDGLDEHKLISIPSKSSPEHSDCLRRIVTLFNTLKLIESFLPADKYQTEKNFLNIITAFATFKIKDRTFTKLGTNDFYIAKLSKNESETIRTELIYSLMTLKLLTEFLINNCHRETILEEITDSLIKQKHLITSNANAFEIYSNFSEILKHSKNKSLLSKLFSCIAANSKEEENDKSVFYRTLTN